MKLQLQFIYSFQITIQLKTFILIYSGPLFDDEPEASVSEKPETIVRKDPAAIVLTQTQTQVEVFGGTKNVVNDVLSENNVEVKNAPKQAKITNIEGNTNAKITFGGLTLENCQVTFNMNT